MSADQIGAAQLLLPAVGWDPRLGFEGARSGVERAVGAGVGGILVVGGEADDVSALAAHVRARSDMAAIIATDPFPPSPTPDGCGAFALPPPAAIDAVGDPVTARQVATIAARQARALGVNLLVAPPCDVASSPRSSTFGSDPAGVADAVAEWVDACRAEGVLCSARAFPGLGRASPGERGLPVIGAADDALYSSDLVPFRAAIDAGVTSVLVAAARYPALDPSGQPAPLSPTILGDVLRRQLAFDGLTIADASELSRRLGRWVSAAELLGAGIDLVVAPGLIDLELRAVSEAVRAGRLDAERLHQAAERRRRWADLGALPSVPRAGAVGSSGRASAARQRLDELAERAVRVVRGHAVLVSSPLEIAVVAADGAASAGIARSLAVGVEEAAGAPFDVRHPASPGGGLRTPIVIAVDPGDGTAGPPSGHVRPFQDVMVQIDALCARARAAARDAVVIWCGHPDHARDLSQPDLVTACWDVGDTMLRAAGRFLVRRT